MFRHVEKLFIGEPTRKGPRPSVGLDTVNLTAPAKRIFDLSFAIAFVLLCSPILILLGALLLIAQGRPIFIKHTRVGRGGRRFPCFKFRTMRNDADAILKRHLENNRQASIEWETTRKLKDDPRVTALGRVLRKSSVDELPQLFNVIRGDMSLVGPRPIVEQEVKFYGAAISQYYSVRPGLTGLWQISGRSDVSYGTRVNLDVAYVESASLPRDMMILMKTVSVVLTSKGSY
jgi:exopolysaccharide production protein ExoY